jgi:hypothetical protein
VPLFATATLRRKGKQSLKELLQSDYEYVMDLTEKQGRRNKIAPLRQGPSKAFIR